ncbi:LytR/AlgR family response regulator transcription factor [Alteromonas gilva]|uniref:LytTR family DNA-binding domain-containing protein n=1 Tax=Alteromonas gilva TaxID=2987522 RepID=A0ABT5KZH4_9ALTE|nr:LytTR family DNA-binding domain-containing protein [Alteromonas gilva]MDC8830161.1 LytTR family DNA-binding domain-containing protein [Alteromonas gilva]
MTQHALPEHSVRFIAKPSAAIDKFAQSLPQLLPVSFEFDYTDDLQEAIIAQLTACSGHYGYHNDGKAESGPRLNIVVVDDSSMEELLNVGRHGVLSLMCGWSNQDAINAFEAGISAYYSLEASAEVRGKQLAKLVKQYQVRVEALKWRLASEQLIRQRACSQSRLLSELTRQKTRYASPDHHIALRCGADWEYVHWQSIRYVEAAGDYMCVHTQEETLVVRSTLTELAQRLPEDAFTRVNRSIIVNTFYVKRLVQLNARANYVELRDGSRLKISRRLMPHCHRSLAAVIGNPA